jgi:hypothetical protein
VENQTIVVSGLTNREFLEKYTQPGRIGLCGGTTNIDKAICRAQRHLDADKRWSLWSHVFFFQGTRLDGHHWVIESDIQIHHKHIQLGAQENRISKFFDDDFYTTLAILDFGLTEAQVMQIIREGLDLVANHEKYSLRELIGTLIAIKRPKLRSQENVMARERSMYCSAFIRRLFRNAGIDLAPGIADKNTAPEDISRTSVPHTTYLLEREGVAEKLTSLRSQLKKRVKTHLEEIKTRATRKK